MWRPGEAAGGGRRSRIELSRSCVIELPSSAVIVAFSLGFSAFPRVSGAEMAMRSRKHAGAAKFTNELVNGTSETEAPSMKNPMKTVLLGVLAAACVGLASPASAAESCTYAQVAGVDGASPSKMGTLTCLVTVAPGKVMSKSYGA